MNRPYHAGRRRLPAWTALIAIAIALPSLGGQAIEAGYISVTPLHLDLTNYGLLADVEQWELNP